MDEATAVETALDAGTFDVLAFVEKAAYPKKMVTVFRDAALAKEYVDLSSSDDTVDSERLEELAVELKKSSLTFELRGYPPGIVQDIQKKHVTEEDPEGQAGDTELIAKAIVGVLDSEGRRDPRLWTPEDVAKLKNFLVEGEYIKLLGGVAEVIFNAAVFDRAADAGFSG